MIKDGGDDDNDREKQRLEMIIVFWLISQKGLKALHIIATKKKLLNQTIKPEVWNKNPSVQRWKGDEARGRAKNALAKSLLWMIERHYFDTNWNFMRDNAGSLKSISLMSLIEKVDVEFSAWSRLREGDGCESFIAA